MGLANTGMYAPCHASVLNGQIDWGSVPAGYSGMRYGWRLRLRKTFLHRSSIPAATGPTHCLIRLDRDPVPSSRLLRPFRKRPRGRELAELSSSFGRTAAALEGTFAKTKMSTTFPKRTTSPPLRHCAHSPPRPLGLCSPPPASVIALLIGAAATGRFFPPTKLLCPVRCCCRGAAWPLPGRGQQQHRIKTVSGPMATPQFAVAVPTGFRAIVGLTSNVLWPASIAGQALYRIG